MRLSILFVDDEPNVLDGLRRMLRGMRREWEMDFADGGESALAILQEKKVDVIMSDMRMPKMDGAQLLTEVKNRYPHVVRIILSGQSDKELVLLTVQVAHRYLAKPCDSEKIISAVKEACILRNMLPDEKLRSFLTRMDSLPSLPALYMKLVEALKDPDVSLKKIGAIISQDLGMTAKLLKMVNSAFFGIGRHVADPAHAVQLLGLESIRALVLTVEIFSMFQKAGENLLDLDELLSHSMRVAALSKAIALSEGGKDKVVDEAFFAGMLHDTGKLLLASYRTEEYRQMLEKIQNTGCSHETAELDIFNSSHSEVGGFILCLWGIPGNMVNGVAFHHNPLFSQEPMSLPLMATAFAEAMTSNLDSPEFTEFVYTEDMMEYAEIAGIEDKIKEWEALALGILKIEASHE